MILLTILATVGKILLIIGGVILLLILLLLFFPFCYRVMGRFEKVTRLTVHVNWLFYLLFLRISYDTEGKTAKAVLHILGIPFQLYPKRPKKEKRKGEKEETEKTAPQKEADSGAVKEEGEENEPEGREPKGRIRSFREKASSKLKKAGLLKKELTDSRNKEAVKHLLSEIKGLLTHYKPRHLRFQLRFSAGDPAATGELLGVASVFPFVYRKGNRLIPDFRSEDLYLRGKASLSGHIILFFAAAALVRIVLDKNIRRMMKHLKAMKG